jgi:hypothetical protein
MKWMLSYRTVLSTDRNIFRDSAEEFTKPVTGFINKGIDDVVPTVTVCTYLGLQAASELS